MNEDDNNPSKNSLKEEAEHQTLQERLRKLSDFATAENAISEERKKELMSYVDNLLEQTEPSWTEKKLEQLDTQLRELAPILNYPYLVERAAEYQLPLQKVEEVPFLRAYVLRKLQECIQDPSAEILALAGPLEKALERTYQIVRENQNALDLLTKSYYVAGKYVAGKGRQEIPFLKITEWKLENPDSQAALFLVKNSLAVQMEFYYGKDTSKKYDGNLGAYFTPERDSVLFHRRKKCRLYAGSYSTLLPLGGITDYLQHLLGAAEGRPHYLFEKSWTSEDYRARIHRCSQDLERNFSFLSLLLQMPGFLPAEIQALELKKRRKKADLWSKLSQIPGEKNDEH